MRPAAMRPARGPSRQSALGTPQRLRWRVHRADSIGGGTSAGRRARAGSDGLGAGRIDAGVGTHVRRERAGRHRRLECCRPPRPAARRLLDDPRLRHLHRRRCRGAAAGRGALRRHARDRWRGQRWHGADGVLVGHGADAPQSAHARDHGDERAVGPGPAPHRGVARRDQERLVARRSLGPRGVSARRRGRRACICTRVAGVPRGARGAAAAARVRSIRDRGAPRPRRRRRGRRRARRAARSTARALAPRKIVARASAAARPADPQLGLRVGVVLRTCLFRGRAVEARRAELCAAEPRGRAGLLRRGLPHEARGYGARDGPVLLFSWREPRARRP